MSQDSQHSGSDIEIDEKLTRHVAELARLELTDPEITLYTNHLRSILKTIEQIKSVDVVGVEPMIHATGVEMILRDDQIESPLLDQEGHPRVLESAPDTLFDGFKVPPIL